MLRNKPSQRLGLGLATVFVPLLFAADSLAQPPGRVGPDAWGWHPMWGMWGFGMSIMMLIFWAAVIVGIVALVRWLWGHGKGGSSLGIGRESPLDVAKRRYATGEINKEEFEQLKRDLA